MSALFIEAAFKTSVVLTAAAVVNLLLYRRTSAASRHLVWTLAVAGLLLLPILSAALPRLRVTIHVAAADARSAGPINRPTGHAQAIDPVPAGTGVPSSMAAAAVWAVSSTRIANPLPWTMVVSALYAAGLLLLLIRLASSRFAVGKYT
jgi:hypothetical protein